MTTLDVSHNPLVVPPKPVVQKGCNAMLGWLKANEAEGRKKKVQGLALV